MLTCAQFAEAYRQAPEAKEAIYFSWAQGYMSALNANSIMKNGESKNLAAGSGVAGQEYTIRSYCDLHPLDLYQGAVLSLFQSLPANSKSK